MSPRRGEAGLDGQQIQRRKLYELVGDRIRNLIIEGAYAPGDRLPPERELMETFGVGRPAVREALLTLEREGFLQLRSGSPAIVTRPSPDHILDELSSSVRSFMSQESGVRDLQAARQLVECAIARRAAEQRTEESLALIRRAFEAQVAAGEDFGLFEKCDVAFHRAIAASLRNPIFETAQRALADWLLEQRRTTLSVPGQWKVALADHERILRAIERGDRDEAEAAMARHLDQTADCYWRAVSALEAPNRAPRAGSASGPRQATPKPARED